MDKKIIDKRKRDDIEEAEINKYTQHCDERKNSGKPKNIKIVQNKKTEIKSKEKVELLKDGVTIIEEKYWELVGDHKFKVDVQSDGTCQAGAKAAALLGLNDKDCKLELAKEENAYLLRNFEIYKDSFAYPHSIKIRIGENMIFKSEEEFKVFLAKNPKAPFMWGDEMQLQITSNMHQVQINVLKISPDGKGTVRSISPDLRLNDKLGKKYEYNNI